MSDDAIMLSSAKNDVNASKPRGEDVLCPLALEL
jgi:hypothetical protein